MAVSLSSMVMGISRSQIKKEMMNRAFSAISKQQIKSKTSRPVNRGSYKVYRNLKSERTYTAKDVYKDAKSMMNFLKILKARNLSSVYKITKSIVGDIQAHTKYANYIKRIIDIQKKYNLNQFDKVIFDLSQKTDGIFRISDLKTGSNELFNNMFSDKKTADNFIQAFHEYIDFRIEALERVGFLNKHIDADIFEVTDVFHDRLLSLDLFNKDIPLDIDFNNYQLFILNEAINNGGISLQNTLEQFKVNTEIDNPEERLKIFKNVCEKMVRYNYLEKIEGENDTIYRISEKGVSQLYMYRDLDSMEKSIYTFLSNNSGMFDKAAYIEYLQQDKTLFNSVLRLMPMEEKKEKKPFSFGRYDANFLFKEFFDNGIASKDNIMEILNDKFNDPGEVEKNYTSIIKRLDKLSENKYLSFDNETNSYTITQEGLAAAEQVSKEFVFTSYDVNVVFNYINKSNGSLSMDSLKVLLNEELKNPSEIEKQYKYLYARFENNVESGYLTKDSLGNYSLSDKGKEEEIKFFGELHNKIDAKISFLKNAHLIDDNYNIMQLFHDVHDCRLNSFDRLIHEIAEINKGVIDIDTLLDGATIYYMYNMGDTKQADDKIKEFGDYLNNRISSLERIEYIKAEGENRFSVSDKFDIAVVKQKETKEFLFMPGPANELSVIFNYIDKNGNSITMQELKDALKKEHSDIHELDTQFKYLQKLFDRSVNNGYLVKDINSRYFITEKGREKESNFTKYHLMLLNQSSPMNGLVLSDLKEKYIKEGLNDPEGKYNFAVKTLDKLTANKFLYYNSDGSYHITQKGVEEIYNHRYFNSFEKLLYENGKINDGNIDIKELTNQMMQDKKISGQVKKEILDETMTTKPFSFGKYDANVIFKEFDKENKSLSLDILKTNLEKRFDNQEEVDKQFHIISKRLDKLVQAGFIDYDPENNLYSINQIGMEKAKEVNKTFEFTTYDLNVVFRYVDDNGGKLSMDDLRDALSRQYTDSDYIENQLKYLDKRFQNNARAGYLTFDKVEGTYTISEKGLQEKNKESDKFHKFMFSKIEALESMGLVEKINDTYKITDHFISIVDKKVNYMDKVLVEVSLNNDGIIDFSTLKEDLNDFGIDDIEHFMHYFSDRQEALVRAGYIRHLNDSKYEITEVFENVAFSKDEVLDQQHNKYIALTEFKVTSFDKAIFNASINDKIDLPERKAFFQEKYQTRPKEAGRQFKMLSGRCEKLCAAGYLEPCENGYNVIKYPDKSETEKNPDKEKKRTMEPLETFKVTKFDYNNITSFTVDGIWDKDQYRIMNGTLDKETLDSKTVSIIKRLNTLSEMELATDLGNGKWLIDPLLIERSKIKSFELTIEQKKILEDMKDFLNFTETQIGEFIYGDKDKIFRSDINNLVKRGLLEYESRDLYGNGNFEKIYFLTTKGKKEICKLFDCQMEDIHKSKIHSRPEELGHDILIYSAFVDAKNALEKEGYIITSHLTDRQMRSLDMSSNQKMNNDYADLQLEFYDPKTGENEILNVEIDIGYAPNKIAEKSKNISNLCWYTNSSSQAAKIQKYANTSNVKVLNF